MTFRLDTDPSVIRLAVRYLSIIVVLCAAFSVALYITSASGLSLVLKTSDTGITSVISGSVVEPNLPSPPTASNQGTTTDTAKLNKQLQQQVDVIRGDLIVRLIILNLIVVCLGAVFSYILAVQTLKPIREAADAQIQYAAEASHELRTPLTIMQTELDIVLNSPRLTLARAKKALVSNYEEVQHLRTLTESLLLVASSKAPALTVQPLDQIIKEAVARTQPLARLRGITIRIIESSVTGRTHAPSLERAIVALLDNAIKYSPRDSRVTIACKDLPTQIELSISDQGVGISPDDLPHIKNRYYRAAKLPSDGHGLGLSIVDQIVTWHDGELHIDSAPETGSIFTIILNK